MSDFSRYFLEEMKPVALDRIKGGLLRRLMFSRRPVVRAGYLVPEHRSLRFSRASYFTAVQEAAEKMTPAERSAWMEDRSLPRWFWDFVEERAREWDSLP